MAHVRYDHVTKVFDGGTPAVDDLTLEIPDGEFVVLVGPSGSGKSTALRMLAGLEDPTAGEISIGNEVVNDLPPRERDIAMVFQSYALYPHMTVADNMGFALRMRGVPRAEIESRVRGAAERLGIEDLLKRRPRQLSGGQRQRVALGRAIVRAPQVFLMDEPLSNLDAKLRVEMRAYLASLHQELRTTTVYVTHDQTEAMTMGDRVAVMRDGRLEQFDAPQVLYDRPANVFVAGFIGSPAMNLLPGRVEPGGVRVAGQLVELPAGVALEPDREVVVGIRPERLSFALNGAEPSRVLELEVKLAETLGADQLVHCETGGDGWLTARLPAPGGSRAGTRVRLLVDPESLHLFDPATGAALR